MEQRHLSRREREKKASEELAARLDALSRPLAERVLGRAIQIQGEMDDEKAAAAEIITYAELQEIALEVGIPEEALERALLEELDTDLDHDPGIAERVTAPRSVRGGMVFAVDRDEIVRRLRRYLESMDDVRFEEDRGAVIVWRAGPDGERIETRTTPQPDGRRQLVEIEWENRRKRWWRWAIGLFVIGAIFGIPTLGGFGILLGVAAAATGVFAWFRRVTRRIRKRVNRALGMLLEGAATKAEDWLDLFEDALEDILDD